MSWIVLKYSVSLFCTLVVTFFFHRLLQLEYYKRCCSDIFHVILFRDSLMCRSMHATIQYIESGYNQLFGSCLDAIIRL